MKESYSVTYSLTEGTRMSLLFRCGATSFISNFFYYRNVKTWSLKICKQYFTSVIVIAQKQPPRSVIKKKCFENMQQIYRRTPMPKCDFNKVALQVNWNRTSVWVTSCKFAAYFRNTFTLEHLWMLASELTNVFINI